MKKSALFLSFFIIALTHNFADAAVVSNIDVIGNTRMDDESIRLLAEIKTGDNLNAEDINQIAKRLRASGYFSTVNVNMSGGSVKINVSESANVNLITVEGNDEISADDLKNEIRTTTRSSLDESVIGADVSRLLTLYQRKGFFGTKINPKKIELPDNRVNIVFEIAEGHPTYISDIDFIGNEKFSGRTLREQILSREYSWWRFMTQFDVFDEDRIEYDKYMIRQFYLRNGYVDFQIKDTTGTFTPDRQYYSVVYKLSEGEKYKFGKIKIVNPFSDVPDSELSEMLEMETDDTYNIDLIENTIIGLRGAVSKYGYAFINVEPIPTKNDANKTIDLIFEVKKTNRIYLNSINILGNVRTFDSVIEQLMPMRAGDPFSLQTIEDGRQRLMRTKYFKNVQMVPTRTEGENLMNLDVKLEEQPTGELSGGIGWSNINGFMIDAGITENNFMGRGQVVQLKGSIAQYQKQAMFSFTEPYLFGRALSAGFDLSYTTYDYSSNGGYGYERDSTTVAGRLGWKLTDNWTQTMRLSASFDKNTDYQYSGLKNSQLYALGTNFKYYNMDTNFETNTHTGFVANFGATYTGFGGTETFMRYNGDVTGLLKFLSDRWQLSSNLDFGLLQSLNDDKYIPRVYRYFLGGEKLRGFDVAGVGSRNWAYQNYALGGMWKLNGSTQLNFPVFIPEEYQIKGFVFADYGMLGTPPKQDYTYYGYPNLIDNDIRTSVGVGVFWNTPMGPMNFSWGWPLKLNEYDREQRFLLSFATQF